MRASFLWVNHSKIDPFVKRYKIIFSCITFEMLVQIKQMKVLWINYIIGWWCTHSCGRAFFKTYGWCGVGHSKKLRLYGFIAHHSKDWKQSISYFLHLLDQKTQNVMARHFLTSAHNSRTEKKEACPKVFSWSLDIDRIIKHILS